MEQTTERRWHEIWMEQCEAAETIRLRYGVESAFDYVVGEKLLNFAEAAAEHAVFAQALPQFVSRVRGMFTPEEMAAHGSVAKSGYLVTCLRDLERGVEV